MESFIQVRIFIYILALILNFILILISVRILRFIIISTDIHWLISYHSWVSKTFSPESRSVTMWNTWNTEISFRTLLQTSSSFIEISVMNMKHFFLFFAENCSRLLPSEFEECYLRLFCRYKSQKDAVRTLFNEVKYTCFSICLQQCTVSVPLI